MIKSTISCRFTEEIPNGKLYFLCSVKERLLIHWWKDINWWEACFGIRNEIIYRPIYTKKVTLDEVDFFRELFCLKIAVLKIKCYGQLYHEKQFRWCQNDGLIITPAPFILLSTRSVRYLKFTFDVLKFLLNVVFQPYLRNETKCRRFNMSWLNSFISDERYCIWRSCLINWFNKRLYEYEI